MVYKKRKEIKRSNQHLPKSGRYCWKIVQLKRMNNGDVDDDDDDEDEDEDERRKKGKKEKTRLTV